MRTTVELPPELMKRAKVVAAQRGESLKTLFTRAVSTELGRAKQGRTPRARVRLPLFGDAGKERIEVSNADVARALAADDADGAGRGSRQRHK
jgi:hypothetical protein